MNRVVSVRMSYYKVNKKKYRCLDSGEEGFMSNSKVSITGRQLLIVFFMGLGLCRGVCNTILYNMYFMMILQVLCMLVTPNWGF